MIGYWEFTRNQQIEDTFGELCFLSASGEVFS